MIETLERKLNKNEVENLTFNIICAIRLLDQFRISPREIDPNKVAISIKELKKYAIDEKGRVRALMSDLIRNYKKRYGEEKFENLISELTTDTLEYKELTQRYS